MKRHSNPITSRVASQQSHHHGTKISFRPPGFSTVDPPVSPFPGPLGGARHITLLSAGSCSRLPRGQSRHGNDRRRFDCCPVYLLIEWILQRGLVGTDLTLELVIQLCFILYLPDFPALAMGRVSAVFCVPLKHLRDRGICFCFVLFCLFVLFLLFYFALSTF